jgi:hypothetical protein
MPKEIGPKEKQLQLLKANKYGKSSVTELRAKIAKIKPVKKKKRKV